MNKITFYWILEAMLLSWDGATKKDLIEVYGINPYIVETAIKLKKQIQNIEVLEKEKLQ